MVENGDWDGDCATWQNWADPAAEESLLFNKANGTGPYKLDHWTPGEEIVLMANESYWRTEPMWEGGPSGARQIKRVVIKNVDEWGTRLAMFEAGDADWIYVPPQYRPQLEPYYKTICLPDENLHRRQSQGLHLGHEGLSPQPAMTPAQFNWQINVEGGNPYVGSGELDGNGIPPDFFSDIHVRKAFNYCFDFQTHDQGCADRRRHPGPGPDHPGHAGLSRGRGAAATPTTRPSATKSSSWPTWTRTASPPARTRTTCGTRASTCRWPTTPATTPAACPPRS